ncbi:DUF3140 domain-containing protein [Streptomyces sp. NPDC060209]|uniref:DUF3140 domain-containing protein n=1 Tax=Streptomyces sp. NPDC060209 TaxID=3347073 RepID=UPI00364A3CCF
MSGKGGTSRQETIDEFGKAVNMTPRGLKKWLATDDSKNVGQSDGGGESVGHASGRRIVDLLEKNKADLSDDDVAHMRKVVGYVHRHLEQRPAGDVTDTRWRHSLMNWGHDPKS